MPYPISLVDIVSVVMAGACVSTTLPDVSGKPRKLWRLGLPPLLGSGVSLLILAGAVVSFEHDATWVATALCGTFAGWLRGRYVGVETDQVWGTVRMPPHFDTVAAAILIFLMALADALSGLFRPGLFPRHAFMAAGCALFAGYLAGRAWMVVRRAMRSPHVEIETH
jgi:hypothetical protein